MTDTDAAAGPKHNNFAAGTWLVADMALNVWSLAIVKALGADYPAYQMVFLRAAVGLVVLIPWILAERRAFLAVDRWHLHLLRVGLSAITLTASFFAVARVPFALFTAINFTRPLILMAMAAVILHERVPGRRWLAGAAGLIGVMIAVNPGAVAWTWGLPALFVVVLTGTGAIIVTRALNGTPAVVMAVFYTGGLGVLTAPFAVVDWQPVAPDHWPFLLAIGALAQAAQYCFIRAHWSGDAGVLGPLSYLSLIFSGLVGYLFFAEVPTWQMLAGSAIIVAATIAVADWRNGHRGVERPPSSRR